MDNIINNIDKCLEKILNSAEFCNSSIYINYLTYLVEATSKGKTLKETIIAMEVFGRDANFNPAEDTIVRSHTYTLRKKLERYYLTEGKDDTYRLRVPKGHYEVAISKAKEKNLTTENIKHVLIKGRYKILIISPLLLLLIFMWYKTETLQRRLNKYQIIDPRNFIWKEIMHSDLPVLVVPGDHFIFNFYSQEFKRELGVRDMFINFPEDFDSLRAKYPDKHLTQSPEPYFPYHSIWSLPPILSILYSYNQKVIMRKSSSISPQMLDEYNVVFLGSIKTLFALRHLLARTSFEFAIAPHKIKFTAPDSDSGKVYDLSLHSSGPNEDLVLALKLKGPVNNTIYIIASYHSSGAPEVANYLISSKGESELRRLFEQSYGTIPEYFGVLFKITGIDKTAYKTEILEYEKYSSD